MAYGPNIISNATITASSQYNSLYEGPHVADGLYDAVSNQAKKIAGIS